MIKNFEELTQDLAPEDLKLIPILVKGFKNHGPTNPIKLKDLMSSLNEYIQRSQLGKKVDDIRIRKLINFIRSSSIIPLLATHKGYFVSYDQKDITDQITSLEQRSQAIINASSGLSKFINK